MGNINKNSNIAIKSCLYLSLFVKILFRVSFNKKIKIIMVSIRSIKKTFFNLKVGVYK
jgi:hypothetical protein